MTRAEISVLVYQLMQFKTKLVSAVFLAAAFCVTCHAAPADTVHIVSVEGGFMIDLPPEVDGGESPVGDAGSGATAFSWHTTDGNFTIGFIDGIRRSAAPAAFLAELNRTVSSNQRRSGAHMIDKTNLSFEGNPGIELRLKRGDSFVIERFILVKNRLYILTADITADDSADAAAQILDSFELIDGTSLIA